MTVAARSAGAGLLLLLGVFDLAFLNLWVLPRTPIPQRVAELLGQPRPRELLARAPELAPAVAVDRAAATGVAAPTAESLPGEGATTEARPPGERPPAPGEAEPVRPPAPAEPNLARLERLAPTFKVYFAHNQHLVTAQAERALFRLRRYRAQAARVVIDGHADRTGVEVYNQWLSQERAGAVASRLVSLGFDRERLVVRGHGADRPETGGGEPRSLRRNRRVEISLVKEVTSGP